MNQSNLRIAPAELDAFDGLFTYGERGFVFLPIEKLALSRIEFDWLNRDSEILESSQNLKVNLRALSKNPLGLRWLSMCSSARSKSYQAHVDARYERVFRDYYFAAYFVGIRALVESGAKRIAVTNLCARPKWLKDEIFCAVDAILKQPKIDDVSIAILDPGQPELSTWVTTAISEEAADPQNLRPISVDMIAVRSGTKLYDIWI